MSSLRIAILGAGDIGGTLGRKWARAEHIMGRDRVALKVLTR